MNQRSRGNTAQGDFDALFDNYAERVYRWALFLGLAAGDAEEITQEVFVTVFKKKERPQTDHVLAAYLFQITRRHVANHRRSGWVKRVFGMANDAIESAVDADAGGVAGDVMQNAAMRQVFKQLPIKWGEVLLLHDLEGYSRREIARILGIAEGTVASRLRYARAAFIEKWTEQSHA
ncbi:MAG: RNA polymerase sigma factor [Deltaproteobacteria bacterium]|nr:RNA polymerase sigma factor [Deltaproteobacteria bacterium]